MIQKLKKGKSKLKKILVITIIIVLVILPASTYFITKDDASWKEGDPANTPYAVQEYSGDVSIDGEGKISSGKTAQELWDQMLENGSRVDTYLNNPEELQILINAQRVTDYLDTRPKEELDKEIDWESINKDVNSKDVQGIVKLKRAKDDGSVTTLTYTDPETFQQYIDFYNDSGSEADKQRALSYFTLERGYKTAMSTNAGIIYGKGEFNKFDLTESQLKAIATVCQAEQGSTKGAAAEASLMANHMDLNTANAGDYPDTGEGLYEYVKNGGWFADASSYMDGGYAHGSPVREDVIEAVRAVLVNGMRILPGYIDEHDCFSDISAASNNGQSISVEARSQYVQHITKMRNVYGADYTFYSFPDSNSDPFGYTSQENREKIGDFYYEFETGNPINKANEDEAPEDSAEIVPDVLCWPTEPDKTRISSEYGMRIHPISGEPKKHHGIDIPVPTGTNVYAVEAGTVTGASYYSSPGYMVTIDHGNGYITKYMHNSEFKVAVGDTVTKGQVIALAGSTGGSTGSHVHFQIEYNGESVDPLSFKYDNGMGGGAGGIGSDITTLSTTSTFYAKVATWNEITEKIESDDPDVEVKNTTLYNMTSTKINYQDLVSGYRMPFDYLWALLVISQEKEFVFDLANLVYDSEIEITVHDNLSVNTNISTDTYTKKTKVVTDNVNVKVTYTNNTDGPDGPISETNSVTKTGQPNPNSAESSKTYTTTNTVITKTNILDVKLTKADVWIVKYTQEVVHQEPETTGMSSEKKYDDENYANESEPDKTDGVDTAGLAEKYRVQVYNEFAGTYTNVTARTLSLRSRYYYKTVDRKVTINNTLESTRYISSPAKLPEEKTDKMSAEPNFVTKLIEYKSARARIISGADWLFEILESGPNTTNPDMAELTRYLLYKATNMKFDGVESFDFSVFDPKNFKSLSDMYGGVSNIEGAPGQIYDFLLAKGVPPVGAAAILGNIENESSFNPAATNGTHTGLCQWDNNGRFAKLQDYANSKGKSWNDIITQMEFLWMELEQSYTSVKNVIMSATEYDSLEYATWYFGRHFEVYFMGTYESTRYDKEPQERFMSAKKWYDEWKQNHTGAMVGAYGTVYYQTDYAHIPYGSSNIAKCGCGPTCFAMIASDYTGQRITPEDTVKWCGNAYYVPGDGTSWSYFNAATKHFELPAKCVELGDNINKAVEELQKGNLVISSQRTWIIHFWRTFYIVVWNYSKWWNYCKRS